MPGARPRARGRGRVLRRRAGPRRGQQHGHRGDVRRAHPRVRRAPGAAGSGWFLGSARAAVPTFVWNGLLIPVVVALYGAEETLIATGGARSSSSSASSRPPARSPPAARADGPRRARHGTPTARRPPFSGSRRPPVCAPPRRRGCRRPRGLVGGEPASAPRPPDVAAEGVDRALEVGVGGRLAAGPRLVAPTGVAVARASRAAFFSSVRRSAAWCCTRAGPPRPVLYGLVEVVPHVLTSACRARPRPGPPR